MGQENNITETEIFFPILGHDIYYVSNFGRVKSIKGRAAKVKILKQQEDYCGYKVVHLRCGKNRLLKVHRLVASVFCKGYSPELSVNHIDGNKSNNHYSNLEWITIGENSRKHHQSGNANYAYGNKAYGCKLTDDKVREIYSLKGKVKQISVANRYGISRSQVGRIFRGQRWKHIIGDRP